MRLPTEQQRLDAIETISARQMTVSRAEQYIEDLLAEKPPARRGLGSFRPGGCGSFISNRSALYLGSRGESRARQSSDTAGFSL